MLRARGALLTVDDDAGLMSHHAVLFCFERSGFVEPCR